MNIILEEYLKNPILSDKDRYEIRQIFNVVDDEKKQNILKNFPKMLESIKALKEDLIQSQEILLWRAISNIERSIKQAKSSWIIWWTSSSISSLKNTI